MIQFEECDLIGYRNRTIANIKQADVTIAVACDFNTAGERLTKSTTLYLGKLYCPINYNVVQYDSHFFGTDIDITEYKAIDNCIDRIINLNKSNINVNVAGNGIYTIKEKQYIIDLKVLVILEHIQSRLLRKKILIDSIRSGGQTGIDEAGIKAARILKIPAICVAPKGWIFRDINNKDIANEAQFKDRFKVK